MSVQFFSRSPLDQSSHENDCSATSGKGAHWLSRFSPATSRIPRYSITFSAPVTLPHSPVFGNVITSSHLFSTFLVKFWKICAALVRCFNWRGHSSRRSLPPVVCLFLKPSSGSGEQRLWPMSLRLYLMKSQIQQIC